MRRWGRLLALSAAAVGAGAGGIYWAEQANPPWWCSLTAVRFGRAAFAAFCVSVDYKWSLSGSRNCSREQYENILSQVHLRSALRLRAMCSSNGGLYIKVGQHIGALEYLLPEEYVRTFKLFHSEAPETPLWRLEAVVEEELGRTVSELFQSLSAEPLGVASLAQCHRGVLRDGREVAVKIQHPDVRRNGYSDMDIIDFLVACVSWAFPSFHFQWLAEEVRKNLPLELDFVHEAHNQEKFASMFRHLKFVKTAQVHWDLTTKRVLMMEFCEGGKVNDVGYIRENGISVDEVSQKLGSLYSEMIFMRGFVHCDPHPGNILVRTSPSADRKLEIVLLDHGLYTQLNDDFRLTYCHLWQALIYRDIDAVRKCCLQLNAGELYPLLACMVTARTWDTIQGGIAQNSQRTRLEAKEIRMNAMRYLAEISQLLNNMPRPLVLILKTNDLLRSIEHTLGARNHTHSYLTMSKCCLTAIGEQEVSGCGSWLDRMRCRARTKLSILMIQMYELWLWVKGSKFMFL